MLLMATELDSDILDYEVLEGLFPSCPVPYLTRDSRWENTKWESGLRWVLERARISVLT